jgi:hypothetical protein
VSTSAPRAGSSGAGANSSGCASRRSSRSACWRRRGAQGSAEVERAFAARTDPYQVANSLFPAQWCAERRAEAGGRAMIGIAASGIAGLDEEPGFWEALG